MFLFDTALIMKNTKFWKYVFCSIRRSKQRPGKKTLPHTIKGYLFYPNSIRVTTVTILSHTNSFRLSSHSFLPLLGTLVKWLGWCKHIRIESELIVHSHFFFYVSICIFSLTSYSVSTYIYILATLEKH